jgi:hypothetical protein
MAEYWNEETGFANKACKDAATRWGLNRRMKKNAERCDMERHLQDYMRYQVRKPR